MAAIFLVVGCIGMFTAYTSSQQAPLFDYVLPAIQMALGVSYLTVLLRKRRPSGQSYVQVDDQQIELKLEPNEAPYTLPWDSIHLLRVQPDKLIYRLSTGQTGEILLEDVPEEHLETVREVIRQAGKQKGVSL
ncbi:hypothetical protein GU926_13760 [Nibribacter ruber]|uniref:YcxB family protein n=1 Tax=Nibribacter ruber TaxID=2698458 RepID=A0A6P1NZG9_9BACT|nr:hypothetical protein [Nibribacter ruber]QHL88440.1 hypothetical protein GU926_13760 [Nibribacter ruber]